MKLQQDEAFTDLTVKLKDGKVRSSRHTVACLSRPFCCILTTDMRERNEGVLTLKSVSMAIWRCILAFYLADDNQVTIDNVKDVLAVAHTYELELLVNHCRRVLVETLTTDNYWGRFDLCKMYLPSAIIKVYEYIQNNFQSLSQSQQFTSLSRKELLELLSKTGRVTTEDTLCAAILKWLNSNEADVGRSLEMTELLRLQELGQEFFFKTVINHEQVTKNEKFEKLCGQRNMEKTEEEHKCRK